MIREAVASDSEIIESLYKLLVPSSKNIHVLPERIEQIKADSNNFLFVYEENEEILGTLFLTLSMCPAYEFRPFGNVEYVFVREEARGRGIGKLLLEHIEQICVSKHCTYIGLMSNAQRENAHRFFESRGYNGTKSKAFKKYIPVSPVDWGLEISE